MPTPRAGESRDAFIQRCIPLVLEEGTADDEEQAYAICVSYWENKGAFAQRSGGRAMKRKTFRAPIELKADGEAGTFKSVFATFNVKDHDGDVTLPGAFMDAQRVVVEGWNHDYGLPAGGGTNHADEEKAWIDGHFALKTTVGRDHYETLKALDGAEEWSYTFSVLEAEQGRARERQKKLTAENAAAKATLAELRIELERHFGDAIALDK